MLTGLTGIADEQSNLQSLLLSLRGHEGQYEGKQPVSKQASELLEGISEGVDVQYGTVL